jgi:hypothetical protein
MSQSRTCRQSAVRGAWATSILVAELKRQNRPSATSNAGDGLRAFFVRAVARSRITSDDGRQCSESGSVRTICFTGDISKPVLERSRSSALEFLRQGPRRRPAIRVEDVNPTAPRSTKCRSAQRLVPSASSRTLIIMSTVSPAGIEQRDDSLGSSLRTGHRSPFLIQRLPHFPAIVLVSGA